MDINHIVKLEKEEVEERIGATITVEEEKIFGEIVESCVSKIEDIRTKRNIPIDEAMEKLFEELKSEGLIPLGIEDFSYDMPQCGYIRSDFDKNASLKKQEIIISYHEKK